VSTTATLLILCSGTAAPSPISPEYSMGSAGGPALVVTPSTFCCWMRVSLSTPLGAVSMRRGKSSSGPAARGLETLGTLGAQPAPEPLVDYVQAGHLCPGGEGDTEGNKAIPIGVASSGPDRSRVRWLHRGGLHPGEQSVRQSSHPRLVPRRARTAATGGEGPPPTQHEDSQPPLPVPRVPTPGRRERACARPRSGQAPPLPQQEPDVVQIAWLPPHQQSPQLLGQEVV